MIKKNEGIYKNLSPSTPCVSIPREMYGVNDNK